ncbi:MAG: guanylate kinase [Anaerolineales bacterium]
MKEGEYSVPTGAEAAFAKVDRYLTPPPLLVVISGPSGVGKDSVVERMQEIGYPFHFVVTATDRAPRPDEEDGRDYHFVSTEAFERMIEADELLEYAQVYGQYKGVPKTEVRDALRSGQDVVMRLDIQGAATVSEIVPQALTIFLAPPSLDILARRLRGRRGDSPTQLRERLETAVTEMRRMERFRYVVVNRQGRLDDAVRQTMAIMEAERCRVGRQPISL